MQRRTVIFGLGGVLAAGPALASIDVRGVFAAPAEALVPGLPAWSSWAGAPALIIVFQENCAQCQLQMRRVEELRQRRPDVRILLVGIYGGADGLRADLVAAQSTSPAYVASDALLERLGRPMGTPRAAMINAAGEVVAWARGNHAPERLEDFLAQAAAGPVSG